MAVEESSHASPLPEAKPTAETTWLHSKAQVSIYLFLLGTWSVRYNDSAWSLYPSVLQIKVWSVPDHVATLSRSLQYLLRHSFKSSLETSKKKKKKTHLKHNRLPLQKILHLHHWVRPCQTKAMLMSRDPKPGAEAQDVADTVIKEVSEQHGKSPILVDKCWSPVLEEHTGGLCGPIPDLSDPWLSPWPHHRTYLNHRAVPPVCVSPEEAICQMRMLQDKQIIWNCCLGFLLFSSAHTGSAKCRRLSWTVLSSWLFVNMYYNHHALRAVGLTTYCLLCWLALI